MEENAIVRNHRNRTTTNASELLFHFQIPLRHTTHTLEMRTKGTFDEITSIVVFREDKPKFARTHGAIH